MHRSRGAVDDRRKTATASALLAIGSLFLPFFDLRANRVAAAAGFSVFASSPGTLIIVTMLIPPLLLAASAFPRRPALAAALQAAASFAAVLAAAFAAAAFAEAAFAENAHGLGPFWRWGVGIGGWLYVAATFLPNLGRRSVGDRRNSGAGSQYWGSIAGLVAAAVVAARAASTDVAARWGLVAEIGAQSARLLRETGNHVRLTAIAVGLAVVLGVPAAVGAFARPRMRRIVFPALSLLQTVPSIALFGLLIAPLAALGRAVPVLARLGIRGIGDAPALIALTLYALYPVIRYSFAALESIDPGVIDASEGMGMKKAQLWLLVRLPLAMPVILHGIRVALVQTIGNATLAKLIGGSGLGVFVFEGLGQASADMVLIGMIAIILLTLGADRLLGALIAVLTPKALRERQGEE
jgi:osmoprotectant transport system permease protein